MDFKQKRDALDIEKYYMKRQPYKAWDKVYVGWI